METFIKNVNCDSIIDEDDKKRLFAYLIKEIQLYTAEKNQKTPLKSIEFNFPVFIDNKEIRKLSWDEKSSVETLVVLSHKKPDSYINIKFEFGEGENKISAEKLLNKAETYKP